MTTSDQINELATALAKAQTEMGNAMKDSTNPHFKSSYADLASVREAARPLATNGIAVAQSCRVAMLGDQMVAEVETRLVHTSGQWMSDTLAVPVSKTDAQGIGSALTYGRRYSLAAFAGIAPADDDGEGAVGRTAPTRAAKVPQTPEGFEDWWTDLAAVADTGADALKAAWEASPADYRKFAAATRRDKVEALKVKAKQVEVSA